MYMKVYAILADTELLPNYFNTYKKALDEVKRLYPDWDDRYDEEGEEEEYTINEVDVKEGHKMKDIKSNDENLTELYIEKGIFICIRKLVVKSKPASDSRRRHSTSNTKSRKKTTSK
jgi:hypothetical protein